MDAFIVGARFFQFASTMVLFGSSLFCFYGLKDFEAEGDWLKRLLAKSAYVALAAVTAGVVLQAAALADVDDPTGMSVMEPMLLETGFGHVLALRLLAALAAAGVAIALPDAPLPYFAGAQAMCGALLVASLAGTGHGAADVGIAGLIHSLGDIAHDFAAAIWIGALVPIAILVWRFHRGRATPDAASMRHGLEGFSRIGTGVVALLVLSGIVNSWFLIGPQRLMSLFTTRYGVVLLVKLALFAAMLLLAAANRFWLTPWLGTSMGNDSGVSGPVTMLKRSMVLETALAVLVLLAVSWLGTLEPPAFVE